MRIKQRFGIRSSETRQTCAVLKVPAATIISLVAVTVYLGPTGEL
jgi:hypothetical protein